LPRKSVILLDRRNRVPVARWSCAIDERKLRASVVLGDERTMEQDPLFGFRILVDIAIKALSKAINDPTTAVLAIDQLHRLLRSAGRRNLGPIRFSIEPGNSA
jgi:Predicted membrane protein